MNSLTDAPLRLAVWLTNVDPSPSPSGYGVYTGDEDLVTPTWVGFAITAFVAIATVLLVVDMNRRVRRTRYRDEIRAKIQAEADAADAAPGGPTTPAG